MSFYRRFAAPVVLAVFGTVSVLGTGLHLLPGCGHFHGPAYHVHAPGHHYTAHGHTGHHHSKPAKSEIGSAHTDCAICRFLAIPRALTLAPEIVDNGVRFEFVVFAATSQPDLSTERPYAARAPPQRSSNA